MNSTFRHISMRVAMLAIALLTLAASASARDKGDRSTPEQRQKWFAEMRQYKRDFMVRELKLTEEQKARFVPIYDRMESETSTLMEQTRSLERQVEKKGDDATDLEKEKAAEALFEAKQKEGAIELNAYRELRQVLTPDQLLKYKRAERKFTRGLMRHQKSDKH